MSYVELRDISKCYPNGFTAIENASITIEKGEFVILLGPSGCGKSTLLRMVAGLEKITDGELLIDGRCVNDELPKDRDIAMVFQSYALYPHMTVFDNMALALKIRKMDKAEIHRIVCNIAEMLSLTDYLKSRPGQLSGGQRQRVALGRAIVRRPKVFLFDEPLSNLDAKLRVRMRQEITALHQNMNATMIYVTHDQIEAMTMGDKVVVIHEGMIQQTGSPKALYEQPVNKFVAEFIGSPVINLIDVDISHQEGKVQLRHGDEFLLNIDAGDYPELMNQEKKNIWLGVRPEDLTIGIGSAEGFHGHIGFHEYLGAENNIMLKLDNDKQITLRASNDLVLTKGEQVSFVPNKARLHFFDRETEQRI